MNVGDKINLHVRVSRATAESAKNLNVCWPRSEADRMVMNESNVTEIQFNGNKEEFPVGTEIDGNAIVTSIESAKTYDETGALQPRFKLDTRGTPVVGPDGKDVVLKRITVRFVDGTYKPALPAETVLKKTA